jgi:adenosine 3'-phospho 5'-phosphosulfate transporter B3
MSLTGELTRAVEFCYEHPYIYAKLFVSMITRISILCLYNEILSVLGYIGGICALNITKTCGVFITMTVTTCRKILTIILSFILFPKPFMYLQTSSSFQCLRYRITYIFAGILAFAGIALNIYAKNSQEIHGFLQNLYGRYKRKHTY